MTAEKMREHISLVEHWQNLCTRREAATRAHIRRTLSQRPGGDQVDEDNAVAEWLANDGMYKRLAAKRNGHQQAALMYGIAALVDATPTRDATGLRPTVVTRAGFPSARGG